MRRHYTVETQMGVTSFCDSDRIYKHQKKTGWEYQI